VTTASIGVFDDDDGYGHETDEELARRAKSDAAAFGVLYDRYRRDIQAFLLSRTRGNQDIASDLNSQVFARAYAALPRFASGSFRGWLYAIARNLVIDEYRRQRPTSPLDAAGHVPIDQPGLDEQVIAADARAQLHGALNQLGSVQRNIVTLRLEGLSGKEIAERLGMSHEAIKSAQYRAFARLRTLLGEL
jgi:RNA polymerase sigma-70 factor (ECF subfamily)